jgi:RES domain-containing protein
MGGAWRLYKLKHAATAFSGDGARQFGGRWNSPGTAVVYVSEHLSMAALELLVHLQSAHVLSAYECRSVTFDEALVERLDPTILPNDWQANPAPLTLRAVGDVWVREARSVLLEVPSAVIAAERNYLINPAHPDFTKVRLGEPQPFHFDARLK